jgi:hypothetical protein
MRRVVDTAGGNEHAEHLFTAGTTKIVAFPRREKGVMAVTQRQATQITNVTHGHPQGIGRKQKSSAGTELFSLVEPVRP